MEHISKALAQLKATKTSSRTLSSRQIENCRKFKQIFPSAKDVISFFSPERAAIFSAKWDELAMLPEVHLCDLNAIYQHNTLSITIIKVWLLYAHKKVGAKTYAPQDVETDANDFLDRCGTYCSVQMLVAYGSTYAEDYCETVVAYYSYVDWLKNFKKKFLPRWDETRAKSWKTEEESIISQQSAQRPHGTAAILKAYYDFIDGKDGSFIVPPPPDGSDIIWDPTDYHQTALWPYLPQEIKDKIDAYAHEKSKPF